MFLRSLVLSASLLAPLLLPGVGHAQEAAQPYEGITEYALPTPDSAPGGIVVGSDGALWFQMGKANKIGRITTNGQITEYAIPTANSSGTLTRSMALGKDGAVWFIESDVDQVGRIGTDGSFREFPLNRDSHPTAITSGPDGALWITEYGDNRIARLATDGSLLEYPLPTPNSSPKGITVGANGALWFVEQDAKAIGQITTSGHVTEYAVPGVDNLWGGIVAAPDGSIWFSEGDQTDLGRITPDGKISHFAIGVSTDIGMTVGPDKTVWITDGETYVGRVAADGRLTGYQTPTARSAPAGIVAGPDGALWFTEKAGNKIGRLMPGAAVGDCRTDGTDVTVPDGSQVQTGANLNKVWRFANCGNTTWQGYHAVRVSGDFGPESFDVPLTAPGQSTDLSVSLTAPQTAGCYELNYVLQSPRGQFGLGFGLIIDVVDPSAMPLTTDQLQAALVPSSVLGEDWSARTGTDQTRCGDKGTPNETATSLFFGSTTLAIVTLTQLRTVDQADSAAVALPQGVPDSFDRAPVDGLGDGAAITWVGDNEVGYQFHVGAILVDVAVAKLGRSTDETDMQARQLADLQEQQLRDALGGGAQA